MEIRGRWDTCKLNVSGVIYPVCIMSEKRSERLNVGGVSALGLGCVVNGQMTKASDQRVRPLPPLVAYPRCIRNM